MEITNQLTNNVYIMVLRVKHINLYGKEKLPETA